MTTAMQALMATVRDDQFAQSRGPTEVGTIREKTWQRLLHDPSDAERSIWARRALEYWTLQARKYGILYDIPGIQLIFWQDEPLVTSRCMVAGVLPGRRVTEKAWREANPPGKLVTELGFA